MGSGGRRLTARVAPVVMGTLCFRSVTLLTIAVVWGVVVCPQTFQKLVDAVPDNAVALAALGALEADAGQLDAGILHLRQAAELWGRAPCPGNDRPFCAAERAVGF